MTSIWVLIGLIIGAIGVSGLGAAFSVLGLADLFSGAVISVILMSSALEFSKFFIAAYLHQAWPRLRWVFKTYLFVAVVVLSLITSMGIFGYLSSAYQESSSKLETENIKLASLKAEHLRYSGEIDRLNKSIDEIPATRISKKMKARTEAEPVIAKLNEQIAKVAQQTTEAELHIIEVKKRVGPLIYIAKAFNIDIDTVVKYLILVFVLVFDPLAICMVIAVSESLQSRQRGKSAPHVPASQTSPMPVAVSPTPTSTPKVEEAVVSNAEPVTAPRPPLQAEEDIIRMRFAPDKKKVI